VPDVYFMLDLYGAQQTERDALLRSAHTVREREDWEVDVAVKVIDYAWMEGRSWKVETFQDSVIPGLLQTSDYARAVMRAWDPSATPQRIERWVGVRIARQRRLTDEHPIEFSAVIGEGALRLLVGGAALMRAQLKHLIDVAAQPNVEIRILPFEAGAHAGMSGQFTILRFLAEQDVATFESRGGDIYMEDAEPFAQALRRLRAASLPQRNSLAAIAVMRRELA
jgi:hypothetical protein